MFNQDSNQHVDHKITLVHILSTLWVNLVISVLRLDY